VAGDILTAAAARRATSSTVSHEALVARFAVCVSNPDSDLFIYGGAAIRRDYAPSKHGMGAREADLRGALFDLDKNALSDDGAPKKGFFFSGGWG